MHYWNKQVLRVAASSGGANINTSSAVRHGDASDEVTRLQRELRDAQARHQVLLYTILQCIIGGSSGLHCIRHMLQSVLRCCYCVTAVVSGNIMSTSCKLGHVVL
jgi:hypothetical protein